MTNYHEQAAALRKLLEPLEDKNPLKLCVMVLACVAENYGAAERFQKRAKQASDHVERVISESAAEVARISADRLLASTATYIRSIAAERNEQSDELLKIIQALTEKPGPN